MIYRPLGPTGIKVSVISYGNWLNSNPKEAQQLTNDCVKVAWDQGINFYDTAEAYGKPYFTQVTEKLKGNSEKLLKPLEFLVITTFFQPNFSGQIPLRPRQVKVFHASISLKDLKILFKG